MTAIFFQNKLHKLCI